MRTRREWILVFLLVALSAIGLSCAREPYVHGRTGPDAQKSARENELEAIPEPVSSQPTATPTEEAAAYVDENEPPGVEEEDVSPGYRVQIFASSGLERAEEVGREARRLFSERVYVEYAAPLYRVRVGDCVTKEEAIQLKDRAIQAGYEGAWVVEAVVDLK